MTRGRSPATASWVLAGAAMATLWAGGALHTRTDLIKFALRSGVIHV